MNKIPCGGFNIGEGLSIDPFTRTLSAPGAFNSTNTIHFTVNDTGIIQSADKTVAEIGEKAVFGEAYNCDPAGVYYFLDVGKFQGEVDRVVLYNIEFFPNFEFPSFDDLAGCSFIVNILRGTKTPDGDVWKIYTNPFFDTNQQGIFLRSAGGKLFELAVNDQGTISATEQQE